MPPTTPLGIKRERYVCMCTIFITMFIVYLLIYLFNEQTFAHILESIIIGLVFYTVVLRVLFTLSPLEPFTISCE
jgi:hypothetical protein